MILKHSKGKFIQYFFLFNNIQIFQRIFQINIPITLQRKNFSNIPKEYSYKIHKVFQNNILSAIPKENSYNVLKEIF